MTRRIPFPVELLLLGLVAVLLASCDRTPSSEEQLENTLELLQLPVNQWVEFSKSDEDDWWPKGHAGMAYDSKRGQLVVFGSETHGEDHDNAIHVFVPGQRRWMHLGSSASPNSYRIDAKGIPISGTDSIQPWAMHTFDGVEYDPINDRILVAAAPEHNPVARTVTGVRGHPLWSYMPEEAHWRAVTAGAGEKRGYFGAATAFDDYRRAFMICSGGLWMLKVDEEVLTKTPPKITCLHRSMAYDSRRKDIYLFGAYKPSNSVWKLERDPVTDEPVSWQELKPGGDLTPPYTTVPVAFDRDNGVFLLVADDPGKDSGQASTFIYDPDSNIYRRIPGAVLPRVGMNFMLAWDQFYQVFFLVTGAWDTDTTVWALRLDKDLLP